MKTLTLLFGSTVMASMGPTQVMFKAAYPIDTDKKLQKIQKTVEDIMKPFFSKWTERLTPEYKLRVERGMAPGAILSEVPWITSEEYTELCNLIDSYFPEDTDEIGALRIADFMAYTDMMSKGCQDILYSIMMEYQERSRIINPFENGARVVPMTSSPIITR